MQEITSFRKTLNNKTIWRSLSARTSKVDILTTLYTPQCIDHGSKDFVTHHHRILIHIINGITNLICTACMTYGYIKKNAPWEAPLSKDFEIWCLDLELSHKTWKHTPSVEGQCRSNNQKRRIFSFNCPLRILRYHVIFSKSMSSGHWWYNKNPYHSWFLPLF